MAATGVLRSPETFDSIGPLLGAGEAEGQCACGYKGRLPGG